MPSISKTRSSLCLLVLLATANADPAFDFVLGSRQLINNTSPGVPNYDYMPDGHVARIPSGTNYIMFWAAARSTYRTIGGTNISATKLSPSGAVITYGPAGSYDNGGAWLMSVFRRPDSSLLGFYHAEDWEFGTNANPNGIAWKYVARATSTNDGVTWQKDGVILSSANPKPATPDWGGNGDHCVVWDEANARWICFFHEDYLMVASSSDSEGRPGTWYKYYQGAFTEPGIGGFASPLSGWEAHAGGNPSVHFNTFLNCWVMVAHTWGSIFGPSSLWISTSADLIHWAPPRPLLESVTPQRFWYTTILGPTDTEAGQTAELVYGSWTNMDVNIRKFYKRSITFVQPAPVPLVSTGAVWRYLNNGTSLGTNWRGAGYYPGTNWLSGKGQLGFGDGDETTVISNNAQITTYFRRAFKSEGPASYEKVLLRVLRDDGAIVYLNNQEVFRSNLPTGTILYSTYALGPVSAADETTNYYATLISPSLLINGTNILAIEIHQDAATMDDLSFDAQLYAFPQDAMPTPQITPSNGVWRLSWSDGTGRWALEESTNLVTWTRLSPTVLITNQTRYASITNYNPKAFWRFVWP